MRQDWEKYDPRRLKFFWQKLREVNDEATEHGISPDLIHTSGIFRALIECWRTGLRRSHPSLPRRIGVTIDLLGGQVDHNDACFAADLTFWRTMQDKQSEDEEDESPPEEEEEAEGEAEEDEDVVIVREWRPPHTREEAGDDDTDDDGDSGGVNGGTRAEAREFHLNDYDERPLQDWPEDVLNFATQRCIHQMVIDTSNIPPEIALLVEWHRRYRARGSQIYIKYQAKSYLDLRSLVRSREPALLFYFDEHVRQSLPDYLVGREANGNDVVFVRNSDNRGEEDTD